MTTTPPSRSKKVGVLLGAILIGSLYAALFGLINGDLERVLIAWPILIALCWVLFARFRLLRFAGFLAVVPVSILLFEIMRPATTADIAAYRFTSVDRSHYTPNIRKHNPQITTNGPGYYGSAMDEILIGSDGFRANPKTGEGNPASCKVALVGDSMIYGSGLPYDQTLRPVLKDLGIDAGVYGVTGSTPADYLATLNYVADRIAPGGQVIVYLYVYNDLVSLHKYYKRRFLSLSQHFPRLFSAFARFDEWRQTTRTFALFDGEREDSQLLEWSYDVGGAEPIRILHPHDPAEYYAPRSLNKKKRAAFEIFLTRLETLSQSRSWHVTIVILPDYPELFASMAQEEASLLDRDPRRANIIEVASNYPFRCVDVSGYLYERTLEDGLNPFFVDNRHFSAFGTRVIAEHVVALLKANDLPQTDYTQSSAPLR